MVRGGKGSPFFLIIFGFVFAVIGVAAILSFSCKTTFFCQRESSPPQSACILTHAKILGTQEQKIMLKDILKAYVDEQWDDDGSTYCVIMETNKGEVKLTPFYSSGSSKKSQLALQINNFIADETQKDLLIVQDDRLFGFIIGGIFFIVGIGIMFGGLASLFSFL